MNSSRLIPERMVFKLPVWILLPLSAIIQGSNLLLYHSSGHDHEIYLDATVRLGMVWGPILLLPLLIGSLALFVAICELICTCAKQKRWCWTELWFVTIGILVHPWILGYFLTAIVGE